MSRKIEGSGMKARMLGALMDVEFVAGHAAGKQQVRRPGRPALARRGESAASPRQRQGWPVIER